MSSAIKGEAEFSTADIVRFLLEATSTNEPPTNAEQLARYLGLNVRGFFHHEHGLDPKIRAYLWPAKREIGVSRDLTPHRRKFSILHEVGHFAIPGHLDSLEKEEMLVDDARTLADMSIITVEMEANRFAADCIFQLERFQYDVDGVELEWSSVCRIANIYDASIVATARRWVEQSLNACALLVFVPVTRKEPSGLRFSYAITSESFRRQYFRYLSSFEFDTNSAAFRAFRAATGRAGVHQTISVELEETTQDFEMQLFSTPYNLYGLIVP